MSFGAVKLLIKGLVVLVLVAILTGLIYWLLAASQWSWMAREERSCLWRSCHRALGFWEGVVWWRCGWVWWWLLGLIEGISGAFNAARVWAGGG